MSKLTIDNAKQAAEATAAERSGKVVFRLYIAGATARSRSALLRARQMCEAVFSGRYMLEVIDIFQQPILARRDHIVATPTLIREYPRPLRRCIGNMANTICLLGDAAPNASGGIR